MRLKHLWSRLTADADLLCVFNVFWGGYAVDMHDGWGRYAAGLLIRDCYSIPPLASDYVLTVLMCKRNVYASLREVDMALKQFTSLRPAKEFSFRFSAKGRAAVVRVSDRFVVTNSMLDQERSGFVQIARERGAAIGLGWHFSASQLQELFEVIA